MPARDSLNTEGLGISKEALDKLLSIDPGDWREELDSITEFFDKFDRLPVEIREEYNALYRRFGFD